MDTGAIHFTGASNTHMHKPIKMLAEMMKPTVSSTKLYSRIALNVIPIFWRFFHSGQVAACEEGQINKPIEDAIIKTESTKG